MLIFMISDRCSGVPLGEVASPLRDAWLNFHQSNLCVNVDAVFVFQRAGAEVWCLAKDEKAYQQFCALFEALQGRYPMEIYPTLADRQRKRNGSAEDDLPPSFWLNRELLSFLSGSELLSLQAVEDENAAYRNVLGGRDLKRLLAIFYGELLESLTRMEFLAGDLPILASLALEKNLPAAFRDRSRAICLAHAKEAGKCAGKLGELLNHALPHVKEEKRAPGEENALASVPLDAARELCAQFQNRAKGIRDFIYPEKHTVDVANFRTPGLPESLKAIQKSAAAFESIFKKLK
jgi:hypothetical protein